jgi:hypothetical protein
MARVCTLVASLLILRHAAPRCPGEGFGRQQRVSYRLRSRQLGLRVDKGLSYAT